MAKPFESTKRRLVDVVADADIAGDAEAARIHGITDRTVRRYRQLVRDDPALSEAVRRKVQPAEIAKERRRVEWATEAGDFLVFGLQKLRELVGMADGPEHIHPVTGALKCVAEVVIAHGVLKREQPPAQPQEAPLNAHAPHRQGAVAPAPGGGAAASPGPVH